VVEQSAHHIRVNLTGQAEVRRALAEPDIGRLAFAAVRAFPAQPVMRVLAGQALEPVSGFEPLTVRLQGGCSAN
jgi:hypothetical protein